jgi:hypothetical protein
VFETSGAVVVIRQGRPWFAFHRLGMSPQRQFSLDQALAERGTTVWKKDKIIGS